VAAVEKLLDSVSVTKGDYKDVKDNIAGIVAGVTGNNFDGLAMSYSNKGSQALTKTQVCFISNDSLIRLIRKQVITAALACFIINKIQCNKNVINICVCCKTSYLNIMFIFQ
jgi:hypothetical protein